MKKLILIPLIILSLTACTTQQNVNNFYNKYQGTENSLSFKAPLFLASLMLGNDEEIAMFRNKVKSVKVLTLNDLNKDKSSSINAEMNQAIQRDNFESWFNMNKDGKVINVSAQNRGKALRNLVVSMQGEDNIIFISAKTNLTETELTRFITRVLDASGEKEKKE